MASFIIIADDLAGDVWPTLKQAKGWVDAGNYDYANEVVIAEVKLVRRKNQPVEPKERFGAWGKTLP